MTRVIFTTLFFVFLQLAFFVQHKSWETLINDMRKDLIKKYFVCIVTERATIGVPYVHSSTETSFPKNLGNNDEKPHVN